MGRMEEEHIEGVLLVTSSYRVSTRAIYRKCECAGYCGDKYLVPVLLHMSPVPWNGDKEEDTLMEIWQRWKQYSSIIEIKTHREREREVRDSYRYSYALRTRNRNR